MHPLRPPEPNVEPLPNPVEGKSEIANLEAKIDELEAEVDELQGDKFYLEDELAERVALSSYDSPRAVFDMLRPKLAAWPPSFWRELASLINSHATDIKGT